MGCKGRNEKTHFKVLLVTNVPLSVENSHDIFNLYSLPSRYTVLAQSACEGMGR